MKFPARNYLVTAVVIVLAALLAWAMFARYTTRPWTRDAQAR